MIPFCFEFLHWQDIGFNFFRFFFLIVSKQTFMKQLKKSSKKTKEIPTLQLPEEVLKEPMLVAEEISRDDLRTGKFQYFTNAGQFSSGSLISLYLSSSKKI